MQRAKELLQISSDLVKTQKEGQNSTKINWSMQIWSLADFLSSKILGKPERFNEPQAQE